VPVRRGEHPAERDAAPLPPLWSACKPARVVVCVALNRLIWVRHEAHCYIARVAGMDWRRCLWI
jgi:hypothetical protein